jgi:hypothetical protein
VAIAADSGRIVAMTGECVLANDIAPEIAKACEQSLQTIVPDIALAQRVPLAIVGNAPVPATPDPVPAGSAVPSTGPSMGDASKLPPLPPMPVAPTKAPQRESDRRPVYLGIGLVVLAIIFYLNRRRRERFEREDARAFTRTQRPVDHHDDAADLDGASSNGASRDPDDEDLHAAAEREPAKQPGSEKGQKKGDDDTN